MTIQVIYYSVEQRNAAMRAAVLRRLLKQMPCTIRVGLKTVPAPTVRMDTTTRADRRWYLVAGENLYLRIMAGLQRVKDSDIVYLAEDDVIYADEHFALHERLPLDTYNYDFNMVHLTLKGFCVIHNRGALALSHSFARADVMRDAVIRKLEELRNGTFTCYEPAGSQGYATDYCHASVASIDIRENADHTWAITEGVKFYQDETGWPGASEMVKQYHVGEL